MIRAFALSACGVASIFILSKLISDFQSSAERERFLVSVLRQHQAELSRLDDPTSELESAAALPDRSVSLQKWLTLQILSKKSPLKIREKLASFSQKTMSPDMRAALQQWDQGISELGTSPGMDKLSGDDLLMLGKRFHYQADGLSKVGRAYDATPLYLWSSALLSTYVERNPERHEIIEAFLLIGESDLRIRRVFGNAGSTDRLLRLCADLFPYSPWAERARSIIAMPGAENA